jgi:predicted  nucleic acid-binding Zn-ribbon protein
MKHIDNYNIFLEKLTISNDDSETVKMAKERINKIEDQISEYKSKKSKVESLYKNKNLSDEDLKKEIEKIIPPSNTNNGVDRNPFLVTISQISNLERRIDKLNDTNVNDKLKIDDLQQSISTIKNDDTKKATQFKISDIKNRMSDRASKIKDIENQIKEKEKEHKEKMKDIENEIKDKISNI